MNNSEANFSFELQYSLRNATGNLIIQKGRAFKVHTQHLFVCFLNQPIRLDQTKWAVSEHKWKFNSKLSKLRSSLVRSNSHIKLSENLSDSFEINKGETRRSVVNRFSFWEKKHRLWSLCAISVKKNFKCQDSRGIVTSH